MREIEMALLATKRAYVIISWVYCIHDDDLSLRIDEKKLICWANQKTSIVNYFGGIL